MLMMKYLNLYVNVTAWMTVIWGNLPFLSIWYINLILLICFMANTHMRYIVKWAMLKVLLEDNVLMNYGKKRFCSIK